MKCQNVVFNESCQIQTVEVDQCTNCKGLWFDMLEEED
jgi:Zn-finger nucleic acid-binding protein